jgi:hypothetical protein
MNTPPQSLNLPLRVMQAQRFLARRGWTQARNKIWTNWRAGGRTGSPRPGLPMSAQGAQAQTPATATWQPLGPTAVTSSNFGLVTGRVSALALDPSDATGNHLYVGTTGGGVWAAQNAGAASTSSITFTPLTDSLGALSGAADASISIGALTVQPGGTGVILAGTGDPNDVLDSYYGAGILRSADGGSTWSLIQSTVDSESGLSNQDYSFVGEGFAGFAWSTVSPQLVVAAVSQAYEGTLVDRRGFHRACHHVVAGQRSGSLARSAVGLRAAAIAAHIQAAPEGLAPGRSAGNSGRRNLQLHQFRRRFRWFGRLRRLGQRRRLDPDWKLHDSCERNHVCGVHLFHQLRDASRHRAHRAVDSHRGLSP